MFRRGLAVCLLLATTVVPAGARAPAVEAAPGERGVIVELFQWTWDSVGQACRTGLPEAGYGAVQVSPPQEHVILPELGYPWWQDYQPVSYQLSSTRRGTLAEFEVMIDTCHANGISVYVDTIINHMAGENGCRTGSAGSSYCHYDYPAVPYDYSDFHHCGRNGDDDIENYQDRYEVQNCELLNLSDLDTGSADVRRRIAEYLNHLLSLGVDGFRIDAAKHVAAGDIAAILDKLQDPAYIYQETLYSAGEPVKPSEYTAGGDVMDGRYARDLTKIFNHEKLAYLETFASPVPSEQAVVFVDNHDTQRSGGTLSYRDNARYALANAFMLAWPYGRPKVMSSFRFSDRDQAPPSDDAGRTRDTTCFSGGWRCEHRWLAIRNMVGFHNVAGDAPVVRWWDNGNDAIAFGRGSKGYLIVNDEAEAVTGRSYHTNLPAGRYCDVIHGEMLNGSCNGPVYTVDANGWFRADVAAHDAIALHVGARLE